MRYFIVWWHDVKKEWVLSAANDTNNKIHNGFTDINAVYRRCADLNNIDQRYEVQEWGQTLPPPNGL